MDGREPKLSDTIFVYPGDSNETTNVSSSSRVTTRLPPVAGAGSSSGVELFQVFMGTGLWQDGYITQCVIYNNNINDECL